MAFVAFISWRDILYLGDLLEEFLYAEIQAMKLDSLTRELKNWLLTLITWRAANLEFPENLFQVVVDHWETVAGLEERVYDVRRRHKGQALADALLPCMSDYKAVERRHEEIGRLVFSAGAKTARKIGLPVTKFPDPPYHG